MVFFVKNSLVNLIVISQKSLQTLLSEFGVKIIRKIYNLTSFPLELVHYTLLIVSFKSLKNLPKPFYLITLLGLSLDSPAENLFVTQVRLETDKGLSKRRREKDV